MIGAEDRAHILERTRGIWEPLRGERVFMTGGTGFVGTWLLEAFAAADAAFGLRAEAVVLTRDPAAFARRSPHLAGDAAITVERGDVLDFAPPRGRFAFVIHAATQRWFEPDARRPLSILESDMTATRRVLDFARDAGTRRLLFTSSGAVYGRQPLDLAHFSEDDRGAPALAEARAAYGEGKRLAEYMCLRYAEQFGFASVLARLFAFVGPYLPLDEGYAAGNFIADALARRPIAIAGDGTPLRSYLYAADLAIWLWTMLMRAEPNRAYNVGSETAVSVAQLAHAVRAAAGVDVPITVALPAAAAVAPARYLPQTLRARTELGLEPLIPLPEALRRTVAWHRAQMHSDEVLCR